MTSPTLEAVARVRRWLAATRMPRGEVAARERLDAWLDGPIAGVDEKTLRLAARPGWNPTANTLARLEALIPPEWT